MDNNTEQYKQREEGIEIPLDRFNPETLQKMIEAFVTRDWSELGDAGYSLNEKVEQVLQRLKENKAKVVFDLTTETCNIVAVMRPALTKI